MSFGHRDDVLTFLACAQIEAKQRRNDELELALKHKTDELGTQRKAQQHESHVFSESRQRAQQVLLTSRRTHDTLHVSPTKRDAQSHGTHSFRIHASARNGLYPASAPHV